jgi:hypothetical protein
MCGSVACALAGGGRCAAWLDRDGVVVPRAAPSGQDHTIRQAAFEYSVMPFSSYVWMIEPNRTVTAKPENPSNQSLGPDPLALANNVIPCSSNAEISRPRSIALPIMAYLLAARDVMPEIPPARLRAVEGPLMCAGCAKRGRVEHLRPLRRHQRLRKIIPPFVAEDRPRPTRVARRGISCGGWSI